MLEKKLFSIKKKKNKLKLDKKKIKKLIQRYNVLS